MEKDKFIDIINNINDTSNKVLLESRDDLILEFEKTKELIINLTRHMDSIQKYYELINEEIGKRLGK